MKNLLLLASLIAPLAVAAQKPAAKPSPSPKVMTAKEQKLFVQKNLAIAMVEKTAEEAVFYEDRQAGVRAMTKAADMMWNELPTRAPKWLERAWKLAWEILPNDEDRRRAKFFESAPRALLRREIVGVALRRDPAMAKRFLKETADAEAEEGPLRGVFDDRNRRSAMLLAAALDVVETDPELAFRFAEQSLEGGISYTLHRVMLTLRLKNPALASRLFESALGRYAQTPADQMEAQVLTSYLFEPSVLAVVDAEGHSYVIGDVRPVAPAAPDDPVRAAEFLRLVHRKYFAVSGQFTDPVSRRAMQLLAARLMPQYRSYAPELAPAVAVVQAQLATEFEKTQIDKILEKPNDDDADATPEKRYEAMIRRLEKAAEETVDAAARDDAFTEAALRTKPADWKRGVGFAGRVGEKALRDDLTSFVRYRAALNFIDEKDVASAAELLPAIDGGARRAVVALALAKDRLKEEKLAPAELQLRRQSAAEYITIAERGLNSEDAAERAARLYLGLATVAVGIEPARAVSLLETALQRINQVPRFDMENNSAPDLGVEGIPWSSSTAESPGRGFGFKDAAEAMVGEGFDDLASLVERIAAKHTRGQARLLVAAAFFKKNKALFK